MGGNRKINFELEWHVPADGEWPKPHGQNSTGAHRRKYIHAKYVEKKFARSNLPEGTPQLAPIIERRLRASQSVRNGKIEYLGMVEVLIEKGRNLKCRDLICAPYLVFELGNRPEKTHFIKFTQNPFWNFKRLMTWDGISPLLITAWDRDKFMPDIFIGRAVVDLKTIMDGVTTGNWIKLYNERQLNVFERAIDKMTNALSRKNDDTATMIGENEQNGSRLSKTLEEDDENSDDNRDESKGENGCRPRNRSSSVESAVQLRLVGEIYIQVKFLDLR
jgi:hypothetical protein